VVEWVPLLILPVIGGLVFAGIWFNRDARIKRALKQARRTPIADVKDGQVTKVVGRLTFIGEPLVAPLTGRTCAYYLVVVEQYRSYGRSGKWVQIVREERRQDFLLDDGSARALVRMGDAQVAIVSDANFKSGVFKDATPVLDAFLARHGRQSQGWLFNKQIRYREGVLEPHEDIAVGGIGRWEPDPDPGAAGGSFREAPRRLRLQPAGGLPLLVSDDPKVM
jgi:hypothetical protein